MRLFSLSILLLFISTVYAEPRSKPIAVKKEKSSAPTSGIECYEYAKSYQSELDMVTREGVKRSVKCEGNCFATIKTNNDGLHLDLGCSTAKNPAGCDKSTEQAPISCLCATDRCITTKMGLDAFNEMKKNGKLNVDDFKSKIGKFSKEIEGDVARYNAYHNDEKGEAVDIDSVAPPGNPGTGTQGGTPGGGNPSQTVYDHGSNIFSMSSVVIVVTALVLSI